VKFLLSGDINISYLTESKKKKKLDAIMSTYNLTYAVKFAMRVAVIKALVDNVFINHRSNTNILALTAPHSHNLQETSCINNEVQVFNKKLHKIFRARESVTILDIKLHRNDFTQHGLHLNTAGKEKVADIIAENIKQLKIKKKNIRISIDEEGNPKGVRPELRETTTHTKIDRNSTNDTVTSERQHSTRAPGRPKRTPDTNILW
jgi:hypothetical protein